MIAFTCIEKKKRFVTGPTDYTVCANVACTVYCIVCILYWDSFNSTETLPVLKLDPMTL